MQAEKAKPRIRKNYVWILSLMVLVCPFCRARTEPRQKPVLGRQIAELAKNLAGIPYCFGGSDIDGFDCSGLVFYSYDCFGIKVPRNAREQGRMPGMIKFKDAVPGDILIFKLQKIWHSAIYLGAGSFIHAPKAGGRVRFEDLNEYWLSRLRKVINVCPHVR